MSDWKKRLQPASFRGVPFRVDTETMPVGREVVIFEYPGKDKVRTEDMGRKTRLIRFAAFVIGAKCLEERDALLAALDKPGEGELIHPWYGRMKVTATSDCTASHSREEGGVVRFELVFVEAGELGFPTATTNTRQQVQTSANSLKASALSRFSQAMAMVNMARVKVSAIQANVAAVYGAVNNYIKPLSSLFSSSASMLDALMNAPSSFGAMVFSTLADLERPFSSFGSSSSAVSGSAAAITALAQAPVSGGQDAQGVQTALVALMQDAATYNGMMDAAAVPIPEPLVAASTTPSLDAQAATAVAVTDVPVADDIAAARDDLGEAIFQYALYSPLGHYETLDATRQAVNAHLSAVARAGVRLRTETPASTVPAVVLAYRLYGDASRGTEIVARNRIRHAGFVPAVELQVARE
ncbi:DNA circularization protein [Herbaspirillum sp. B65]|uniref:DNA circularization protein n=1 Tax=Herbaspirillum sp. B65 TaxID=137708 RepID=UPI000349A965|nr:DNA circularization N-terminal domain-containing protein [Herbaspirillum sp. B65]